MKLEEYGYALTDASACVPDGLCSSVKILIRSIAQAISLDPKYAKAYYRCDLALVKQVRVLSYFVGEQHATCK
jgi:hypothetical protein